MKMEVMTLNFEFENRKAFKGCSECFKIRVKKKGQHSDNRLKRQGLEQVFSSSALVTFLVVEGCPVHHCRMSGSMPVLSLLEAMSCSPSWKNQNQHHTFAWCPLAKRSKIAPVCELRKWAWLLWEARKRLDEEGAHEYGLHSHGKEGKPIEDIGSLLLETKEDECPAGVNYTHVY